MPIFIAAMTFEGATITIATARSLPAGREVAVRARVAGVWEAGGRRMCLAGDATGLIRVALGSTAVEPGQTYVFRGFALRAYSGGWHSLEPTSGSEVLRSERAVEIAAGDEYITRVMRILTGLERKRGRLGVRPKGG